MARGCSRWAGSLTDYDEAFLKDTKYLLLDRDTTLCPLRGALESRSIHIAEGNNRIRLSYL